MNAVLQGVIVGEQKRTGNIDKAAVKRNSLYVGVEHVLSVNHLSTTVLWPWKECKYFGNPSRKTFILCKLVPLFMENIPQLGVSIGYLVTVGGEVDMLVVGSSVCSIMSILFTLLGSLSVSSVMDDDDTMNLATTRAAAVVPRAEEEEGLE